MIGVFLNMRMSACVRACVCACVCVCVNKTLCILAESESLTLIQKLARFSMKQAGKDYNPSAIHPQTGASIHPLTMSETSAMPSAASSCEKGCVGEGTRMNVTSSGTSTDAVHSLPAKTAEPDGGKEVQRGMWLWNGRGKGGTERYVTLEWLGAGGYLSEWEMELGVGITAGSGGKTKSVQLGCGRGGGVGAFEGKIIVLFEDG